MHAIVQRTLGSKYYRPPGTERLFVVGVVKAGFPGKVRLGVRAGTEGSVGFREAMGRQVMSQAEGNSMRQELIKSALTLQGGWALW